MSSRPENFALTLDASGLEDPSSMSRPEAPGATREAERSTAGVRTDWFPTPIWRFNVASYQTLNEKLMQLIRDERERDPAGMSRSTVLGWHSTDQLHCRPEWHEFVVIVHKAISEVSRSYRIDTKQVSLELATCWAIVNGKLASNVVHCHPNSFLSGVYYVSVTEESGDIFFQEPRQGANMLLCPVTEFTPLTIRQVTYRPRPGAMLIFPSWLYHGVGPNLTETPRVSLSFNFRFKWISHP
jgi:uncharacterized protein (TIGR02466 family)